MYGGERKGSLFCRSVKNEGQCVVYLTDCTAFYPVVCNLAAIAWVVIKVEVVQGG